MKEVQKLRLSCPEEALPRLKEVPRKERAFASCLKLQSTLEQHRYELHGPLVRGLFSIDTLENFEEICDNLEKALSLL